MKIYVVCSPNITEEAIIEEIYTGYGSDGVDPSIVGIDCFSTDENEAKKELESCKRKGLDKVIKKIILKAQIIE